MIIFIDKKNKNYKSKESGEFDIFTFLFSFSILSV